MDIILKNLDHEWSDNDFELKMALYLINHGCDDEQDKVKLLCEACVCGNWDVIEELVEQHNVDLIGEYHRCVPSHCTI